MRSVIKSTGSLLIISALLSACVPVVAQTPTPPAEPAEVQSPPTVRGSLPDRSQKKPPTGRIPGSPLIVETTPSAPQVVTLLHRLSGLKMFRLLLRSGDVKAIAQLDEGFRINGQVHTNVIAGLALDDGETVAAWLPEVDAEIGLALPPLPTSESKTGHPAASSLPGVAYSPSTPPIAPMLGFGGFYQAPDVTVIARDHRRMTARYVGLDGVTGVSVLKLAPNSLAGLGVTNEATEKAIAVGQRVHLFSPGPAPEREAAGSGAIYVRLGEIEGEIVKILNAPSGTIARLEISSPKVSTANIGGVAINDAGETIGIVDTVKGTTATILPASVIRAAAKRVLSRQASVPRPWLGVRGEPLGAFSMDQLLRNGWSTEVVAKTFADARRGLLVTSVAPGSPAFLASLNRGDLILSVNQGEIFSADDFSWLLEEAGPEGLLRFTVARPGRKETENVEVKLAEAPDPFFGLRTSRVPQQAPSAPAAPAPPSAPTRYALANSLWAKGLETVALRPQVASRLGSNGGLLVLYVQPATVAFKAGLLPGDVIESIDGRQLIANIDVVKLADTPGVRYAFSVVRNKKRMVFTMAGTSEPSR